MDKRSKRLPHDQWLQTDKEANNHILRNILVHTSSHEAPVPGKEGLYPWTESHYTRTKVALSLLMAAVCLQLPSLACSRQSDWVGPVDSLGGLYSLSLASLPSPSQSWCYFSATLANAFSKNVRRKIRILIIPSEADGLVPPAPLLFFSKINFSSWPNSLDFALALYSTVQIMQYLNHT